ncbi:MAG: hypothetical protein ACRD5R_06655 [Candidatus Acidiferrales bacterium]
MMEGGMSGFHSHDDDFLYERQSQPSFNLLIGRKKRTLLNVSVSKWDKLHDAIRKRRREIARLIGVIVAVKRLL